jgi:hypothetical protein
MSSENAHWQNTLLHLLALAAKLEGAGQYNLAKLLRAAADSMGRQAAYRLANLAGSDTLTDAIVQVADALSGFDPDNSLPLALKQGAATLAAGGVPLIDEAPHPYVCRTCGQLTLAEPTTQCPTCGAWPDTYQRFLPNYWFDALEPFAALERLRQTPGEVASLLAGVPEEAMTHPPEEGGWAIRNGVTHLRDAQSVLDFRVDRFRQEEHPKLEMQAVWAWATNEEERPPTTLEIFASYQASRTATLSKLEQMPLADWWRTGQHQEFGVVTLRQQVSYFAAHELTHLPQIERLRRQWLGRV